LNLGGSYLQLYRATSPHDKGVAIAGAPHAPIFGLDQTVNGSEPAVAPERAFNLQRSGVNVRAPSGRSPLKDQFGRKLSTRPCLTPAVERAQKAGAIVKGAQSGAETYLWGDRDCQLAPEIGMADGHRDSASISRAHVSSTISRSSSDHSVRP